MTRRKKLLLVLLVLVLVSQIPFAYRRYKLGRLHSAIQLVNSQRLPDTNQSFTEYTGVIHVHSFLGGHSTGGFEEIIAAAKSNHLNFVVMTEHTSTDFNTAAMTLKGVHGGILFVNGNEVATASSDRLLLIPGDESAPSDGSSIQEVIAKAKARGALTFVAYPHEFKGWNAAAGYDGVEVYNVYTNAQQIRPLVMFFDSLWSYRTYPNLLFADFYSRPDDSLRRWDEAIASRGRALVAVAGNDAHANVGINLQDASGKPLLGLQLDPYERSFQLVRVHVLVPKGKTLESETLLEALGNGHCFIGFDLFGDTGGFSFSASNGAINKIQGDEISLEKEVRLTISTPVTSRVILFKDGQRMLDETEIKRKDYVVTEKGSYRVEVYLPQLPDPTGQKPWIISNPIYVR
jgi:hypothetical protein